MELNLEEIEKTEGSPFVERFEEFFNTEYKKQIERIVENYPEQRSLIVNFKSLEKFDPMLADELLDNPDSVQEAAHTAIQNIHIPTLTTETFKPHVRFNNLPKDREIDVRDIGSKHIGKMISVEGLIRLITDVLPKLTIAVWKCKRCGNVYKIPQEKQQLHSPNQCECHSKEFTLEEEKSQFIDSQKVQLQETLEKLKGNEQATYLDVYVHDDIVNKVSAGDKTRFVGILRLLPPQKDKKTVYGRYLEVVSLEETAKEFAEVDVTKEEEEKIKDLSKNPQIYEMLAQSIAPSIYGHDIIKESIALQLFGGVTKHLPNNQKIRGNAHILLIGDPGCLVGDERIAMGNGAIKRIEDLGETHLQEINYSILSGEGAGKIRKTKTFFHYPQQKTMEIITESGKSIKGTFNHPLQCITKENERVKRIWKRLDEFKVGDKVAVTNYIPCTITAYIPTGFKQTNYTRGPTFKGKLPEKATPKLAALLGYMLGDGWVRKKEACLIVANKEKDLLPELIKITQELFAIKPSLTSKKPKNRNEIMHLIGIHSTTIAQNLLFLREKRVPKIILESGNEVAAEFLKWLYQADGCVFSKGRGKRAVSLKAKNIELLRDVQMLLLRFSIHSRILGNALMIRRGDSIKKFGEKIGFASKEKKEKMRQAAKDTEEYTRFGQQRSEKIVKIIEHGLEDVYDIEVEKVHRFIANGIISHNSGKSQLLQATNNIAPKSIYISGKTSTGAGLCVAPETLVLNDSGFKPIQEFVEENFIQEGKEELPGCFSNEYCKKGFTLGENLKLEEGQISKIWRIKAPEKMIKIKSRYGKELSLTQNTALIRIKSGTLKWIKACEIKEGDYVACARKLPESEEQKVYSINLLRKNKNIKINNNISKQFKEISDSLIRKGFYKDLTELAKKIGKSRNTLYAWRTTQHYHGIPLHTFMELAKQDGKNIKEISEYITELFILHGKNYKIPKTINNPKIAYLAGILFGDGSIHLSPKRAQIRLYNNSKEVLDAFDEIMKELFGIETEKYTQKGVGTRRCASLIVYELLKEFGLSNKKLENKISHSATEMRTKNLNPLLRGLFDTDGFVSTNRNGSIGLSTISKQLAQTIQLSLLKSGIISKIRKREVAGRISKGKEITVYSRNPQYYVEITGSKNTKQFLEKIGFNVKRKQVALKSIIKETQNPNLDIIPEIKELLQNEKINWNYRKGKRNPSREKLLEYSEQTNDKNLKTLAESDILWEEIVEKSEFKPEYEYVYDFTIEGTHNFIANGFITHNTATAVKDEFGEGGWTLKAGALVLASGGVCMADELDKMDPEDRSALHEAMEQGMISVAKAGIVSRFKADTSLLAAANPKYSRFDKFIPLLEQIDLPPSLISRFDLFFMIRDVLDRTQDQKISEHILKTHQSGEKIMQHNQKGTAMEKEEKEEIDKKTKPIIDRELFSKYVSYARQKCFPILTEEAMKTISEFYVKLRDQGRSQGTYTATARQLEGLVRLAEASAKVRLSDTVEPEDSQRAIKLVQRSLEETVVDPDTGRIDIDIITTGVTQARQNAITTVLKIIKEEMATGIDMVPIEIINSKAQEKGLDETKVNAALDELEKKGEIYKPRHHHVKPTTHREM